MSYLLKKQLKVRENNLACLKYIYNNSILYNLKKWLLLEPEDFFVRTKGTEKYSKYSTFFNMIDLFGNHFQYEIEGTVNICKTIFKEWITIEINPLYDPDIEKLSNFENLKKLIKTEYKIEAYGFFPITNGPKKYKLLLGLSTNDDIYGFDIVSYEPI
jgi:hypothetical protein